MSETIEIKASEVEAETQAESPNYELEIKKLRQEASERRRYAKELELKLANIEQEKTHTEQKQLEEQSKFKELYEQTKSKLTELDTLKARLQEFEAREEQERQAILDKLPDPIKEKHAGEKLDVLKTIYELTANKKASNSVGAEEAVNGKNISSLEDIDLLAKTNPKRAIELLNTLKMQR